MTQAAEEIHRELRKEVLGRARYLIAERELLRLRYIEGVPPTVIAARSGASAGAVRDRSYRARRRAREVAYAELGFRGFP